MIKKTQVLLLSLFGTILPIGIAYSAPIPLEYSYERSPQVTSVSQLSDVRPTDWAYTALQSLVERYGVIAGYPNRTFRGNKPLTRFEFAAALNATLEKVNELIDSGLSDKVSKDDLDSVAKLQSEFATELTALRSRVNGLEAKTAMLETQQFSTNTKLSGEAVFSAQQGSVGNTKTNVFVSSRVRLDLDTSFTGSDLLQIRLQAGNNSQNIANALGAKSTTATQGSTSNIGFNTYGQDYGSASDNFALNSLYYAFNLGETRITAGPVVSLTDLVDKNSYANLSSKDFSSTFFINNPLLILTGPGAGGSVEAPIGPFNIRIAYVSANANQALSFNGVNAGLTGDSNQAFGELEFAPQDSSGNKPFALRLQYTNGSVNNSGIIAYGANLEWSLAKGFGIFGRYGNGIIDNRGAATSAFTSSLTSSANNLNPQTWQFGLAFPNLFKEGALAGLAVGQPFIERSVGNATQTNVEAFYSLPVSKNISITPDVQVILNPNNSIGSSAFVGTLRTVFSF